MTRLSLAVLASLALVTPGRAAAQDGDLRRVMADVSASWARGDASGVVAHVAGDGVAMELGEGQMAPIGRRQAAAMLRRLFDDLETVDVRVVAMEPTGGAPARAFGELAWSTRGRETGITGRSRVFLGFEREGERWVVTQIRLLR